MEKDIRSTLIHDSHVFRSAYHAAVAECRFLPVLTRIGVDVGVLADARLFLQVPRKRRLALSQAHTQWRVINILSTMRRAHGRQFFFFFPFFLHRVERDRRPSEGYTLCIKVTLSVGWGSPHLRELSLWCTIFA